jgi:hypothetical protein
MSYYDVGGIIIIFVIFPIAHYFLTIHPLHLLLKLFSEFRLLAQGGGFGITGAVNALGLIVVALIGALIYIEGVLGSLLALAVKLLRPQQAQEYVASVTALTLFITIAMLAALSVLLTMIAEMSRRL